MVRYIHPVIQLFNLSPGNNSKAKKCFEKAYQMRREMNETEQPNDMMDAAMLAIAESDYKRAVENLKKVRSQSQTLLNVHTVINGMQNVLG